MIYVGMHEAKTRLSELVQLVKKGERVIFTNRGEVVAELHTAEAHTPQHSASAKQHLALLDKLRKKSPIGTFNELMEWRREGLRDSD